MTNPQRVEDVTTEAISTNRNGLEDQAKISQITYAAQGPSLSPTVTGKPLGHLNASAMV